jgi:flagellin
MAGTINTNIGAVRAANALATNERDMNTAMEWLSTGKRINSAQDDAAGLAIASKMTSQINSLDQAVRNAGDAISMVQSADGAMIEVTNMTQRMRELAIQAISDTNTSSDRAALNLEYQALAAEISRIGGNTQWNGGNIIDGLNGTAGTSTFHIGANANQVITATFPTIGSTEGDFTVGTATNGGTAPSGGKGTSDVQVTSLDLSATFGVLRNGDTVTYTVDGKAASAIITSAQTVAGDDSTWTMSAVATTNTTGKTAGAVAMTFGTASKLVLTGAIAAQSFVIDNVQVTRGIGADVAKTDISSFATATAALNVLDEAVASVNMKRADLGATANRLEYASDNMANVAMNARQSRSRVEDADYATETTELARTQIIQQAGTAMLAQANQSTQSVLKLLQ